MASIIRRKYKVTLPDGTTTVRTCSHWIIQFRDLNGKVRRVRGYKDRGATKQLAAQIERDQARGETGLLNPFRASMARPIGEHVDEWVNDLKASGRCAAYQVMARRKITILADGCHWKTLRDVTANSFTTWRAAAKTQPRNGTRKHAASDNKKGTPTTAARTLNSYLEYLRTFLNWCATTHRIPGVPIAGGRVVATVLAGVTKVDGPVVCRRRALTDAQATKLLCTAPPDRALVYRVAMSVGLRRQELEALQWGDLRMNGASPYIALRAEATKAGRADRLSLPPTLAAALIAHRPAECAADDPVFPRVPTLAWWKRDLKKAGIPYLDAQGRQADFHGGTRKTLCTRLHRAGVPLAIAMRTMRHTDARLTLVDYVDSEGLGAEHATAMLPELVTPLIAAT